MQIKDILSEIEKFAPLPLQESYDNSGIQCGDIFREASGALLSLDVTEAIIEEAIEKKYNLVIAHHPLIFSGLKKITGKSYVERCLIKAIKNDIVIYACHTNLDNVQAGVNKLIADKIGLKNTSILQPLTGRLLKLQTYVPAKDAEKVLNALFDAGAGHIGEYSECSFSMAGRGTFRPSASANPRIGSRGGERETVEEEKLEVILPDYLQSQVLSALRANHPYEEVAYELIRLENANQTTGAGRIGELETAMRTEDFFTHLKTSMGLDTFKYTAPAGTEIKRVAVCGGSGSFLLEEAIAQKADIFITSDFKYHQFFDAEHRIIIADIGHYESEHYTPELFLKLINKKFPNFAVHLSCTNTNPVNFYY